MGGNPGCPCVNTTAVLASLAERSCVVAATGEVGAFIVLGGSCVPLSYGSSRCRRHDLNAPGCRFDETVLPDGGDASGTALPAYCLQSWCYVEAETCVRDSEERVYRSVFFGFDSGVDLYYSYETCNATADDWLAAEDDVMGASSVLHGVSIKANIPTYYMQSMFKRDPLTQEILGAPGSEYYDNDIPFGGTFVDYATKIAEISGGDIANITYTHRSRASSILHPMSSFTAAVQDIADGLVDMSVGPFFLTAQRLKLTAFTFPLFYDRTVLMIRDPNTSEQFSDQLKKVYQPFTAGLWLAIFTTVAISSLFGVWFFDHQSLTNNRGIRVRRRTRAYLRLAVDSCLQKGMFFCSGGVDQDPGATLSSKVLMSGFGIIILTSVSAYVANLAAFLTRKTLYGQAVTTMEGAVEKGVNICAHPAIKTELKIAWPTANFVFDDSGFEYEGLLNLYEEDECEVLAVSISDTVHNPVLQERFCELELVMTSSFILEMPIAFPIRSELAAGFSYWTVTAEKVHGVSIQTVVDQYLEDVGTVSPCETDFKEVQQSDKFAKVGFHEMALPFILYAAFFFLGIIIKLVERAKAGTAVGSDLGRTSSIVLVQPPVIPNPCRRLTLDTPLQEDSDVEAEEEETPLASFQEMVPTDFPGFHMPKNL